MKDSSYKVYRYRWVVLACYSLIQAMAQCLFITFAPITGDAAAFYRVTSLQIGLLSMCFMFVLTFLSIPSAWAIDTFGVHKGMGLGVILVGGFAITRGLFGDSYNWVLASMLGMAIGHPFILSSVTTMAAKWFPLKERATAAGIAVLSQLVGIMVGMAATPFLTIKYGIPGMLRIYAIVGVVSSISFLILYKEKPPSPPDETDYERTPAFEGLRQILKQRDMILLISLFFIALGIFNAITTWIEQMIAPRGFTIIQAGTLGAVLMVGGIVGCLVIPPLSDRFRKRKLFIFLSVLITLPGLAGMTFVTSYVLLLASGFIMGFFFMGGGPVIYQYSAEISHPAPEATSQALLIMAGQIAGIIFIFGMDIFKTESGSMTPFLLVMMVLASVNIILASMLKESHEVEGQK